MSHAVAPGVVCHASHWVQCALLLLWGTETSEFKRWVTRYHRVQFALCELSKHCIAHWLRPGAMGRDQLMLSASKTTPHHPWLKSWGAALSWIHYITLRKFNTIYNIDLSNGSWALSISNTLRIHKDTWKVLKTHLSISQSPQFLSHLSCCCSHLSECRCQAWTSTVGRAAWKIGGQIAS